MVNAARGRPGIGSLTVEKEQAFVTAGKEIKTMHEAGAFLFKHLIRNKLIIFSILLIVSYTYIIRDDYIAADAYIEPSDNYVFITNDKPVEVTVRVAGSKINSVLFSLLNPETASEASTAVDLYDGGQLTASILLSNNNFYEVTDSLGSAVEFFWPGGGKN
ncbi:MAG: hypothetical protein K2G19_09865 [Lachnospiraceae bacterium]|nr:hypothetical protein [Lachnospiraceae bacterium]